MQINKAPTESWATLTKLLKNNTHTQKKLPHELENVNWINTLFDFLAVEPAHSGNGTVFELEFLIPDVSSFSTPSYYDLPSLTVSIFSLNVMIQYTDSLTCAIL